jgi:MEMO1 family protein
MENQGSGTRPAAVAGAFYPYETEVLEHLLRKALAREKDALAQHRLQGQILGGIVPHAGMKYCAAQAVHFFEMLRRSGQQPQTVILAHPNHYGQGPPLSVDGFDLWEGPFGSLRVDRELAEALQLPVAPVAQAREHSAEAIIPYLQFFLKKGFRIVAVNMLQQDLSTATRLAAKVIAAEAQLNRKLLFVASTDFSHFLSAEEGARRDAFVIREIESRNPAGVEQAINTHQASVCGSGPIMALMEYCRMKDPGYQVHILRQGDSGEVHPAREVVRYVAAAMLGKEESSSS